MSERLLHLHLHLWLWLWLSVDGVYGAVARCWCRPKRPLVDPEVGGWHHFAAVERWTPWEYARLRQK